MSRRRRLIDFGHEHADAIVALLVLIEIELELALGHDSSDVRRVATALAAVAYVAPLVIRRDRPGLALVVATSAAAVQGVLGGDLLDANGVILVLLLLCYSVGSGLDARAGAMSLGVGGGLFALATLFATPRPSSLGAVIQDLVFVAIVCAAPWFVGRLVREREQRAAAFRELASQAEAERAERERAAIAEERLRIGGELQDVIAHSVSAMLIQAGGARKMLRSDPERARESIVLVEETGRETLADMRRLLGVLRRDDDPRALAPQPGLDQLEDLVQSHRSRGLDCVLLVEGTAVDLTPGIDLVAYRAVEAAVRCAAGTGSAVVSITVRFSPRELTLEVKGDGPEPALDEDLGAMSKRVALYDGRLRLGSQPGGTFAVMTHLPLAEAVAA